LCRSSASVSLPSAGAAYREQVAEQVVARVSAPLSGQRGEVREQLDCGGVDRGQGFNVVELEDAGQIPRDWPESLPVCLGDPDQLADHSDRQQVRKVLHELDGRTIGAAISHGVEQIVGHLGDRGLQPGDPPGSERAGYQAPDPRMPRCVQVEDPVCTLDEHRICPPAREVLVETGFIRNAEAGIAQDRVNGVVPGHQHVTWADLDRVAHLVQCGVQRVRICPALGRAERGEDLYRVHGVYSVPRRRPGSGARPHGRLPCGRA